MHLDVQVVSEDTLGQPAPVPTAHEQAFARQHTACYCVYRVYGYHSQTHSGQCYIIAGNPELWCEVTPTQYRLRPR
jgi:hypothetical protein